MTEDEIKNAIRTINAKLEEALEREKETEGTEDTVIWHMVGNDYKCAIKALEEIQKYRAIGTVEEVKRMQRYSALAKKHSTIGQVIDSCAEYEAIGTVEECREARERQIPKKPNITTGQNDTDKLACCPTCDSNVDWTYEGFWRKGKQKYCHECGQAIDWSETV